MSALTQSTAPKTRRACPVVADDSWKEVSASTTLEDAAALAQKVGKGLKAVSKTLAAIDADIEAITPDA